MDNNKIDRLIKNNEKIRKFDELSKNVRFFQQLESLVNEINNTNPNCSEKEFYEKLENVRFFKTTKSEIELLTKAEIKNIVQTYNTEDIEGYLYEYEGETLPKM